MTNWKSVSRQFFSSLASTTVLTLGLWVHSSLAADPFERTNPHDIGNKTGEAFKAMFEEGDYKQAQKWVTDALSMEPDEPMVPAMQASLFYLEDNDKLEEFGTYATQTRETAEQLTASDPLRGHLYAAVGHFLEGAYTLKKEGTVRGTPKALAKLREVFQNLEAAEAQDPTDPEINIIKGFMDLMLAVNLPFANPEDSIERLRDYAGPKYLAHRGLAIGYRDLDRLDEAMEEVDKAQNLTPENPEVQYLKAQIFVEKGQHEESLEWFQKAWKKHEKLPREVKKQLQKECNKAYGEVQGNRDEELCKSD